MRTAILAEAIDCGLVETRGEEEGKRRGAGKGRNEERGAGRAGGHGAENVGGCSSLQHRPPPPQGQT
eukprot:765539-Hanusia_phi.AAC.9